MNISIKILFFSFLLCLTHHTQAQNFGLTMGQGDDLFKMIGKSKNDTEVKNWLRTLGKMSTTLSNSSTYTYPQKGISIRFNEAQWIDRIMLYDNTFRSGNITFNGFEHRLPAKLSFSDTKKSILQKISVQPTKSITNHLEYNHLPANVVLYFENPTEEARLLRILIRYKSCISGDCQNGFGSNVDQKGKRYEGHWKDGKPHGNGTMFFKDGKKQDGVWSRGRYKGKNFFKTHKLYDLLGKHKDSKEIQNISKKYGNQREESHLAYDHIKYSFNNRQLILYFNDYGYLYKLNLNQSGFKDYSDDIIDKLKEGHSQNHVRYLFGEPNRRTSARGRKSWFYKKDDFGLKLNFNTQQFVKNIEIRLQKVNELMINIADGECKKGDCQNGYGEFVYVGGSYKGFFKHGKINGEGTMTYTSGGVYIGAFQDGLRSGFGIYTWSDGSKYAGTWSFNEKYGKGTMSYPGNGKYVGDWYRNKRHGYGAMIYASGDKYVGRWSKNLQSGKGVYYSSSGVIQSGMWYKGHFRSQ
jgi:hypothetical protein